LPDSSVTQKREQTNDKTEQNISLSYVEPLTKKFKTELNYIYVQNITSSNRSTYDYNGAAYDIYNPVFSNSFQNTRLTNRAGLKLIYEVKKYTVKYVWISTPKVGLRTVMWALDPGPHSGAKPLTLMG
jgi:hypothetical protein